MKYKIFFLIAILTSTCSFVYAIDSATLSAPDFVDMATTNSITYQATILDNSIYSSAGFRVVGFEDLDGNLNSSRQGTVTDFLNDSILPQRKYINLYYWLASALDPSGRPNNFYLCWVAEKSVYFVRWDQEILFSAQLNQSYYGSVQVNISLLNNNTSQPCRNYPFVFTIEDNGNLTSYNLTSDDTGYCIFNATFNSKTVYTNYYYYSDYHEYNRREKIIDALIPFQLSDPPTNVTNITNDTNTNDTNSNDTNSSLNNVTNSIDKIHDYPNIVDKLVDAAFKKGL